MKKLYVAITRGLTKLNLLFDASVGDTLTIGLMLSATIVTTEGSELMKY